MTRVKVYTIADGGGYLVAGEQDVERARELAAQHLAEIDGEWGKTPIDEARASLAEHRATPGWYRWNVAPKGSDWPVMMADGFPGQPGSFQAIYFEVPW